MFLVNCYNWMEYDPFELTINYADYQSHTILILIRVGSLGVCFGVGGGEITLPV